MTEPTPDTRPAGHAPAGRFAFTRPEDEDPFRPATREYDANGHYAIGPRLATPPLVRMIRERFEIAPAREKKPAAERRRMGKAAGKAAKARKASKPTGHAKLAHAALRPRWLAA